MLVNIMQVISVLTEEASPQIILDTGAVIQGISIFCMALSKINWCMSSNLNND